MQTFSGEMPRVGMRILPEPNAQLALNVLLTAGVLEPLYVPQVIPAVLQPGTIKSVYRMYDPNGNSYWLNWTSDVDVARQPIGGDTSFRIAYTSVDFEPRQTNLALASSATPYPGAWFVLGVTPPITIPVIGAITGGSAPTESRAYIYTLVTQWGEESAPTLASTTVTGNANGSWAVTIPDVAPPNTGTISGMTTGSGTTNLTFNSVFGLRVGEMVNFGGSIAGMGSTDWRVTAVNTSTKVVSFFTAAATVTGTTGTWSRVAPHNIVGMTKRIYRSVTANGVTDFFFVGEIPVATTTFADAVTIIGEPIATTGWAMPPADMQHVQTTPSGALVGFSGNTVCFSEPFSIYAWPLQYQLVLDYPIVGIGTYGDSVVAATSGQPYVAQGTDPSTMTETKVDNLWPCLSKRGVVGLGIGVAYPTPQGLAVISANGAQLVTDGLYTFREWSLAAPSTFIAAVHDNRYYAAYTLTDGSQGVLILDQPNNTSALVPTASYIGTAVTRSNLAVTALYTDRQTGKLYFVSQGVLNEWNANFSDRLPMDWWSKEFVVPNPINLGAAKIDADFSVSSQDGNAILAAQLAQIAANAVLIAAKTTKGSFNSHSFNTRSINGSLVVEVVLGSGSAARFVQFSVYVNGVIYYTTTRINSNAFRLPAGKKYDNYSVRITGNAPVKAIVLGETMVDLKSA